MGRFITVECSAREAVTHGCASCSNAARPAARKSADSRLMRQLRDAGPKMPTLESDTLAEILASRASLSTCETGPGESWSMRSTIHYHPTPELEAGRF